MVVGHLVHHEFEASLPAIEEVHRYVTAATELARRGGGYEQPALTALLNRDTPPDLCLHSLIDLRPLSKDYRAIFKAV